VRILVADVLDPSAVTALRERGHDCVVDPSLAADDLAAQLSGVECLVVRSTKVTAAAISAGSDLRLVVRAGSGLNTIDTSAAAAAGVAVANVPGANAIAVAELTFGLLLAIDRSIVDATIGSRAGEWNKKRYASSARGLAGATMGIVGLGAIGAAVAQRAVAFGMSVRSVDRGAASDRVVSVIDACSIECDDSLVTLASKCDVLTVHVPANEQTRGMVDREVIAALPQGAIFINTSRADVVDSQALLEALDADRLSAGLDVFPDEPAGGVESGWRSPLAAHRNVVSTHHVGASTEQAQRAVAAGVVTVIDDFASGA